MDDFVLKVADLNPPLGGGPCRIVDRILKERIDQDEKEELIDLVEGDHSLSNPQAHEIYDPLSERGPHPFTQFVITPHAQYRMDLRGVSIKNLKDSMVRFMEQVREWQRTRDPQYAQLTERPKFEWLDPKSGLFFVFALGGYQGTPSLITTYWKNKPDPHAPADGCSSHQAGYRAPAGEISGYKTFVSEKPSKGIETPSGDSSYHAPGESPRSDRQRALPQKQDNKEDLVNTPPGPPVYNTPGPSTSGWNNPAGPLPKNEKIKVRSPGTPGEEYGHPYKENIYPRRTATDLLELDDFEGKVAYLFPSYSQRQHKQQGQAKRYTQRYYRRHKSKYIQRARRRYKKLRNNPTFKRQRKLRMSPKYKNRYRRIPSRGFRSTKDRAKHQREKKATETLGFYHLVLGWGDFIGFSDGDVEVHLDGDSEDTMIVSLESFVKGAVFEEDEGIEAFFQDLEEDYETPSAERVATFYRETFKPGWNMDPGDGAQDLGEPSPTEPSLEYPDQNHDSRAQSHKLDVNHEMHGAPGSAKVIPSGYGFVNKEASAIRVAKRLAELMSETSPAIQGRAKSIRPRGKRFDPKNAMYSFNVPGSEGNYTVRLKIQDQKNAKKLSKMDIRVSCTCDFWRWQGPEHWAKVGGYLYGATQGSASRPVQKDPSGENKLCKHVVACLRMAKDWELPSPDSR